MFTTEILQKLVSFQDNAYSLISKEKTILSVLDEIRSGVYASQINELRSLLSDSRIELYTKRKSKLPAITFCGTFSPQRKQQFIRSYNCVLVIDIDKLDNSELIKHKHTLSEDPFIFAFWTSPSNNGLKGLVHLSYPYSLDLIDISHHHKQAFKEVFNYFKNKYSLIMDESGSDVTRLCFFSYDPLLLIKEQYEIFAVSKSNPSLAESGLLALPKATHSGKKTATSRLDKNLLFNPLNKNNPHHRILIQSIIRYLKKYNLSITESYQDWLKVAFAVSNSFTYEIGEKYFISLSKNDPLKFDELATKKILLSCYTNSNNSITFKSIIFLAIKQGYEHKGLRGRGSSEGGARESVASFSI